MRLNEEEAEIVRYTFRRATADQARAAECVYQKLFEIAPSARDLFVTDPERLGMKVMSTLGAVTAQLQNWDMLAPTVEDMARRHLAYGVRPEHYAAFGQALQEAMAEILDEAYDGPTQRAWERAYALISDYMIDAAYGSEAPAEV